MQPQCVLREDLVSEGGASARCAHALLFTVLPTSAARPRFMRRSWSFRSSSVKNGVSSGRSGNRKIVTTPMRIVGTPSTMKRRRQLCSMVCACCTPNAMRPPNALRRTSQMNDQLNGWCERTPPRQQSQTNRPSAVPFPLWYTRGLLIVFNEIHNDQ